MPTQFHIEERADSLLMRSERNGSWWTGAIYAVTTAVFVGYLAHYFLAWTLLLPCIILLGIACGFAALRKKSVSLKITILEVRAVGNFGDYQPCLQVSLADIQRLEYRPEISEDSEGLGQLSGLYADLDYKSVCLLPHLDEAQTNLAIETIYRHFPLIPVNPKPNRSILFQDEIIGLNLNECEKK